jgi:hypothetical protein
MSFFEQFPLFECWNLWVFMSIKLSAHWWPGGEEDERSGRQRKKNRERFNGIFFSASIFIWDDV